MLTEVDMIRILAEKSRLAESIAEEFIDNTEQSFYNDDEIFEFMDYDRSNTEATG